MLRRTARAAPPHPPPPPWTIVVLEPVPGAVALGVFLDGELLYMIDEPAGEAWDDLVPAGARTSTRSRN